MKILIDLQACQTEGSANRGIGRYAMDLLLAIKQEAGTEDEIHVLLNGNISCNTVALRKSLLNFFSLERIHTFCSTENVYLDSRAPENLKRLAELAREAKILDINPDVVLVTSLFEGLGDLSASAPVRNYGSILNAVIVYDLIPLIFSDDYLTSPQTAQWYHRCLDQLIKYDLFLTISSSTQYDVKTLLGVAQKDVISISSACGSQFTSAVENRQGDVVSKWQLDRGFVMYTGGIDFRKNIEKLIEAYGLLDQSLRNQFKLVVVCKIAQNDRKRFEDLIKGLGISESSIVFTGFVSDEELVSLYQACDLFVFPSIYEGFGLPVLEAMACGAPVVASNSSSVSEIVQDIDRLFNPYDAQDMSDRIASFLSDPLRREESRNQSLTRAADFSWARSAQTALAAVRERVRDIAPAFAGANGPKKRLAFVSPIPPDRSGIASYSAELLPYLSKYYDIEVFSDAEKIPDDLSGRFNFHAIHDLVHLHHEFDRILYQVGNSDFHSSMLDLLNDIPGTVVLHDAFLSGLFNWRDKGTDRYNSFDSVLFQAHGWRPFIDRSSDRLDTISQYEMNGVIANRARGIIVHSQEASERLAKFFRARSSNNVAVVPQHRAVARPNKYKSREIIGISQQEILVTTFGHVANTKMSDVILDTVSELRKLDNLSIRVVFVGGCDVDFEEDLLRLAKDDNRINVSVTGFVSESDYSNYLAASDLAIQLRRNSRGETSRAVLDCMAFGVPLIINAHGTLREISPWHALVLDEEVSANDLAAAILAFANDRSDFVFRAQQAYDWLINEANPSVVAERYATNIEKFYFASALGCRIDIGGRIDALLQGSNVPQDDRRSLRNGVLGNVPVPRLRTLFLDITRWVTGSSTDPVAMRRAVIKSWQGLSDASVRVEPCFWSFDQGPPRLVRAARFMMSMLGLRDDIAAQEVLIPEEGDIYVALRTTTRPQDISEVSRVVEFWQRCGIRTILADTPTVAAKSRAAGIWEASLGQIARGMDEIWIHDGWENQRLQAFTRCYLNDQNTSPILIYGSHGEMTHSVGEDGIVINQDVLSSAVRSDVEQLGSDVVTIWMDDPRMASQVGLLSGRMIESAGQDGTLVYGPYTTLIAGHHRVVFYGIAGLNETAQFDVTCGGGEKILSEARVLVEKSPMPQVLHTFELAFESVQEGIEFRVHVECTSQLSILKIELETVHG